MYHVPLMYLKKISVCIIKITILVSSFHSKASHAPDLACYFSMIIHFGVMTVKPYNLLLIFLMETL